MGEKIALVTDSTCDLPQEWMEELGINFLPIKIIYSDGEYRDRVDIQPQDIYRRFAREIPGTSMPSLAEFRELLQNLKKRGFSHVIAIHISAGLSATCDICRMAAEEVEDITVEVIDSRRLSMGLGRLVLYARELLGSNEFSFQELVDKIRSKIESIDLFFVVETLEYLKKGGRIGRVQGTVGELLNIKPIISINADGEYYNYGRARTRTKSIRTLAQIARDKIEQGPCKADVMHADAAAEAEGLMAGLKEMKNVKESYLGEISPAMSVHAGPGLIGVCITRID